MKTTRRILSMLLCLALVLGFVPALTMPAQAASGKFVKVTTAPSDWSGTYLIVYEAGKVAFNGSMTTLDVTKKGASVTISNGTIDANDTTKSYAFTITKSGNNYLIKSSSGYYIGQTSNANGLKSSQTTTYANTLSINADGSVNIVSGGAYLRFNSSTNEMRFRYYKSSTYTGQKAICLYKFVETTTDEPECECTNTSVKHENGKHIETCLDCGQPVTTSHTVTVEKSAEGHWEVCSCGKYDMSATPTTHDYTVKYDDDKHWNVCGCGYTTDPVEHTLVDDKCDCGYEIIPTNNYEKITTAEQLVSGKYVMIIQGEDGLYAPTVFDGETDWVLVETPNLNGDVCNAPASFEWTLTVNGTSVTLTDSNGVSIAPEGGNNNGIMEGPYNWVWAFADGTFTFSGTGSDTVILASNKTSDYRIRAYKTSTVSGSPAGYPSKFTLYKLVEETPAVPAFDSAAPVLKNDLAMNFYVPKAMFENTGYTNPYAVFNFDGNDYTVSTYTEATVNEVAMLVFTFKNIAPHKADTTITYTLKSTYNGEEVSSESGTYSVLEYCTKKLKAQDSSEKLKTLVSDLLNYCAAVQTSLGKTPLDTSAIEGFAPTTTEVTLTSCKAVTENNIENPVAAWDTATLILKDKVIVRFYFAAESIDGLSVKIAGAKNATITEIKQEGDLYYVDFTGLLATDMRKQITATVYSGDTAVSETVTYSIESYAASYQNVAANGMGALVKAMMKYGDSAENYQ